MPLVAFDPPAVVSARIPRSRDAQGSPPVVPTVTLFCGPWRVQFLPVDEHIPPPRRQRLITPKSNGCGTRIHAAAVPKRGGMHRMWRGSTKESADVVISLEDRYVPRTLQGVVRTLRSPCGSDRSGNPLGALIARCSPHTRQESPNSVYEFAVSAVSPPLPPQSGPSNTQTGSASGTDEHASSPTTWRDDEPTPRPGVGIGRRPNPNGSGFIYTEYPSRNGPNSLEACRTNGSALFSTARGSSPRPALPGPDATAEITRFEATGREFFQSLFDTQNTIRRAAS
ncbi:hypothetical protein DFH07DRAFT_1036652 [Mycena maculata]|uniref:Uncharacterized protein n=1 Tax=Mycena maculata TaxID=230809 RepID=A0AAD7N7Y7_9AGAR|nr:hypothetical protein DFH07DRAFT_1036652 [Mycena maculata]